MVRWDKIKIFSGAGCLILFALPFLSVGVFAAGYFFSIILAWTRMQFWMEPATPLLDPEKLMLSMVFTLTFGGAGTGIICAAVYGTRRLLETAALQREYPEEPWRWNREWNAGVLHANAKLGAVALFFFALIWNGLSLSTLFVVPGEVRQGNTAALLVLVFPLVGAWLLYKAVHKYLQWRRFGDVTFEMASVPAFLGDRLRGTIRIPVALIMEKSVTTRLMCVHSETTGGGKNRQTYEKVLWEAERIVPRHMLSQERRATVIPIEFHIPDTPPPSDDTNPDDKIVWRLHAETSLTGVDFSADFEVPVFDVPEGIPDTYIGPPGGVGNI